MDFNITIIYEPGEDGWFTAFIPEVPGAISQGHTRREARIMVLDALKELMAARRDIALRELDGSLRTESLALTL